MAALLDLDWLFYVAGGMLGVAALWLLWRGLLADRSRGRARCPRCWYDLAALLPLPAGAGRGEGVSRGAFASVTCPECGRVVKRERQMRRTRRRWWVVTGGMVVVVLAAAALVTPKVRRDGVWVVVPTWAMIKIDQSGLVKDTATLRSTLRDRLLSQDLPDWEARGILLGTGTTFRCRERWPQNIPLWCEFALGATDGDVEVSRIGGPVIASITAGAMVWSDPSPETRWDDGLVCLGVCSPQSTLRMRWPRRDGEGRVRECQLGVELPVRFVPSVDEVIAPVSGPEADEAVRRVLRARVSRRFDVLSLHICASDITSPVLAGVTLGVRVELLDGEKVVGTARWWQRHGSKRPDGEDCLANEPRGGDGVGARSLWRAKSDPSAGHYTVRIRSDGEMALRDLDGTRYWKGEVVVKLSDLVASPDPGSPAHR